MRNTTVHDRFQVSRSGAGFLCNFRTFSAALEYCAQYKLRAGLIVFDVMAHYGRPESWDGYGKIIVVKGER